MSRTGEPTVEVSEQGRSGCVRYRDAAGEIEFYWELAGGDAAAAVRIGTRAEWLEQHAWAAERRAEILRFVGAELVKQKAPTCRAEIDEEAGWLYLRETGATRTAAGRPAPARPEFSMSTYRRLQSKLATVVFVLAAIAGGLIWLSEKFLSIDPGKGIPAGAVLRTDRYAASLIQRLEPYVPSLHRDHGLDRYSLGLFLVPLDGSATRLVPLREHLEGGTTSRARLLGSDGRTMWYDADGVGAVDLTKFEALDADAVRRTPPPPSMQGPRPLQHADEPDRFLAAGFLTTPKSWLGLLSDEDLERSYQPGKYLRGIVSADSGKAPRRFYSARLEPDASGKYHRILDLKPLGDAQYAHAAFLRPDDSSEPYRIGDSGDALMVYTSAPAVRGTTRIARVDRAGSVRWDVDTGIDRFLLSQILPGERSTVFVGPRPPIPDKLSEPLLVIVDHSSGAASTYSLWQ